MKTTPDTSGAVQTGSQVGASLYKDEQIAQIRCAAQAVWRVLQAAICAVKPGATTKSIDDAARAALTQEGATSAFEGYRQGTSPEFPGVACVCVNDEVVHGIPGPRILMPGDLVGVDVGLELDGWYADSGASTVVEPAQDGATHHDASDAHRLVQATRDILKLGIDLAKPGTRWSFVGMAMEREVARLGFKIVTEYVGHGIGRKLHEPPKAPAYWTGFSGNDFVLEPGMVLAVEPILTIDPAPRARQCDEPPGRVPIRVLDDGWTVQTRSGVLACHEERMIAINESGPEILSGSFPGPGA